MTERASIFQTVQLGVETTAGSAAAANKLLQSVEIQPGISLETKSYRAMGHKFPSLIVPTKEGMQAKISGAATYTELVYLLSSLLSYAAPAQQGGTIAYLWTFAPSTTAADTVKTFTVEQGSSVRAHKFTYGQVTELEIAFSRAGIDVSGNMIGRKLADNISMTATPTALELVPVLPEDVDIYLADTAAGLNSATALARAISVSWKMGGRFGPFYPLASSGSAGFAGVVEKEPKLTCKLLMEADAEGMGLLTTARAGDSKFLRIKALGDLIASTYYYKLQIDAALKVEGVGEFRDEDGIYALEWEFSGVHDATWGKSTQISIINKLSSL